MALQVETPVTPTRRAFLLFGLGGTPAASQALPAHVAPPWVGPGIPGVAGGTLGLSLGPDLCPAAGISALDPELKALSWARAGG